MKTWIWPLSWYYRIRQLEAENELLRAQNRKLDASLRAAAIQQASMAVIYTETVAAIAASVLGSPR